MAYAENTSVSVDRSEIEIKRTLLRYDADQILSGMDMEKGLAMVAFRMHGKHVKFFLPIPRRDDPQFSKTPSGRRTRNSEQCLKAWEQAQRQKWRALSLAIKAKLECVETGITTFEDEFLAHIVLPNGLTVAEFIIPQIELAYEKGTMPNMLPMLEAPKEAVK